MLSYLDPSARFITHLNETLRYTEIFLLLASHFGTSRYVRVLKDEATHCVELVTCDRPTSEVAAAVIPCWYSRFGVPNLWISDSASYFTSKLITDSNRRLKAQQQFTLAYTPWEDGSVESVNRVIIQVLKALIFKFKVGANLLHLPVFIEIE